MILRKRHDNAKGLAVMAHDLATTPLALGLALYLRYPGNAPVQVDALQWVIPLFTIYAGVAFRFFRLYELKWRFASLPDLFNIFRVASLLAISLLVVDFALVARGMVASFAFGEKACFLYWVLQMALLGGPRIAYRYFRYVRSRQTGRRERAPSILVLGRSTEAEIALRSIEEGMRRRFFARGVLSPRASDRGASIRGVPVLGGYDELERIVGEANEEGNPIARLIFAPSEYTSGADSERVVATAKRLGVALSRLQTIEYSGASALAPIEIEDLLFRPSVQSDLSRLGDFVSIPSLYLVTLGLILLASILLVRTVSGPYRRMTGYLDLFFMGAAFLLLETKNIVQFALLFGTTWFVNALVIAGVLVAVFAAVEVSRHVVIRRPALLYVGLLAALVVAWAIPPGSLLSLSPLPRFIVAVIIAFAPIFLANMVFAQRFRNTGDSSTAFGANLLGAMIGGILEYSSLIIGYRWLLVLVALLYGLAFITGRRHLRPVAPAGAQMPQPAAQFGSGTTNP